MSRLHVPTKTVFWEGVPVEDLGISEAISSVKMTVSVGRSRPSKRFAAGKPKVGGASIEMVLLNQELALRVSKLLNVRQRPSVVIAFGYDDSHQMYVGAFGPGAPGNVKDLKKVGSFKMDKPSWTYPSNGIAKVSMNGLTDKALALVDSMKPRTFINRSIRSIFQEVAADHSIEVEFSEDFGADDTIKQMMKPAHESDYEFLARLGDQVGASALLIDSVMKSQAAQRNIGMLEARGVSGAALEIEQKLKVTRLPVFLTPQSVGWKGPLKIGYGPGLINSGMCSEVDVLAKSINVSVDGGYKAGSPSPTAARASNEGADVWSVNQRTEQGNVNLPVGMTYEQFQAALQSGWAPGNPLPRVARTNHKSSNESVVGGGFVSERLIVPAVGADAAVSEMLRLAAQQAGFDISLTIELFPGLPFVAAGQTVQVIGTYAHDGLYGIEDCTHEFNSSSGYFNTLKCVPIGSSSDPAAQQRRAASGQDIWPVNDRESGAVNMPTGVTFLEWQKSGRAVPKPQRPTPTPVPAN